MSTVKKENRSENEAGYKEPLTMILVGINFKSQLLPQLSGFAFIASN